MIFICRSFSGRPRQPACTLRWSGQGSKFLVCGKMDGVPVGGRAGILDLGRPMLDGRRTGCSPPNSDNRRNRFVDRRSRAGNYFGYRFGNRYTNCVGRHKLDCCTVGNADWCCTAVDPTVGNADCCCTGCLNCCNYCSCCCCTADKAIVVDSCTAGCTAGYTAGCAAGCTVGCTAGYVAGCMDIPVGNTTAVDCSNCNQRFLNTCLCL